MDAIFLTRQIETKDIIFYANYAAEELFGYNQEEIYEISWEVLVDKDDPLGYVFLEELSHSDKAKCKLVLEKMGQNSLVKYPPTTS